MMLILMGDGLIIFNLPKINFEIDIAKLIISERFLCVDEVTPCSNG